MEVPRDTSNKRPIGKVFIPATAIGTDLSKVLSCPITPVPASLAYLKGLINKTGKTAVQKKLETKVNSQLPFTVDVCVTDAMFLIRSLVDLPAANGGVAGVLLSKLCAHARCVDFVCDTCTSPSIKDNERHMLGAIEVNIVTADPEQKRLKNVNQALSFGLFKISLYKLLAAGWEQDTYKEMIDGHEIYLALEEVCYKFEVKRGSVFRQIVPELGRQHEEADSRLICM
ncbi:hypothetical protein Hamer_G005196 [Homarus americanus]|uniref:Uncharacterized protein n=1 Tax=Homarus americanus TaxID=6706 RepID=A0A8J5JVA3_HOMAM|nr:hypothetical protein Hamer_G005196 [Homarus americanus]